MHRSALDYGRALQRRHTELLVLSLCHRSHGLCCNDRRGDRIKFKYQERCLRHRDRISDYVHGLTAYWIVIRLYCRGTREQRRAEAWSAFLVPEIRTRQMISSPRLCTRTAEQRTIRAHLRKPQPSLCVDLPGHTGTALSRSRALSRTTNPRRRSR